MAYIDRIRAMDYYEVLDIPRDATFDTIGQAYRNAIQMFSPQSVAIYSILSAEEAAMMAIQVETAFRTLRDPVERRKYDKDLERAGQGPAVEEIGAADGPPQPEQRAFSFAASNFIIELIESRPPEAVPSNAEGPAPSNVEGREVGSPKPAPTVAAPAPPPTPRPEEPEPVADKAKAVVRREVEGPVPSKVEGPVPSTVEGPPPLPTPKDGEAKVTVLTRKQRRALARAQALAKADAKAQAPAKAMAKTDDVSTLPPTPAQEAELRTGATPAAPLFEEPHAQPVTPPAAEPAPEPPPGSPFKPEEHAFFESAPGTAVAGPREPEPATDTKAVPVQSAAPPPQVEPPPPAPVQETPAPVSDTVRPPSKPPHAEPAPAAPDRPAPVVEIPAPDEPVIGPHTVYSGPTLRKIRERSGLDLHDIAAITRITYTNLKNLEDEVYRDLPALVYVRGYLVQYSKCIKLDPQRVVSTYIEKMRAAVGEVD